MPFLYKTLNLKLETLNLNKTMYDIIIIGAGPAGYVAAIRAAQVGLKAIVVEKKYVGGMCLNWGCITTKALIESAKLYSRVRTAGNFGIDGIDEKKLSFNWEKATKRAEAIVKRLTRGVEYLFKKNGVELIMGEAVITSPTTVSVENRTIEGKYIFIATGSYPNKLEKIKNTEIEDLVSMKEIPGNITLIGNGGTAVELVQLFSLIGKDVNFIVSDGRILPKVDIYLENYIVRKMKADKVNLVSSSKFQVSSSKMEFKNGVLKIGEENIKTDIIINCNWRGAILPKSEIDIETTEDGYIRTNENLQTNYPNIYAIGDVNGRAYLAHVASAQGIWVVNNIKGVTNAFNLNLYPYNIYTNPEMAQIGLTEEDIKGKNIDYKINEFPLTANGRALTEDNSEGLIRMLSDKKYGEVLGVQIIAHNATDLISEASAYMQLEGTIYDVAQTIHAHPTVSEIFMEAGFDAMDKAINK
jgi:dihydrolipoamide dehydrogenase